jgi:hypothetical protein
MAPGPDRPVFEEAAQVVRHRLSRGVALMGIVADGFENDRFEVAGEGGIEPARRNGIGLAHLDQYGLH